MSEYGSSTRAAMKRSMERPSERRRARFIPTWWDRNSEYVGGVLYGILFAFIGLEIILLYGIRGVK